MERKFGDKVVIKADLKPLNKLIATFAEANSLAVKVGILADRTARTGKGNETNASIGLKHEFGSFSDKIPERSFIRMPLRKKQGEIIRKIQNDIGNHLLQGVRPFLMKVGMMAERAIGEAFRTGGFGSWAPIKPITAWRKGTTAILIETAQLERSITSRVVKRS